MPEPLFDLTHETIGSQSAFDRISARRMIVFAAALSDTTTEANFVRSVFSEDARRVIETGTGVFVDREDTWRRNQRVIYLAAADVAELVSVTRRSGSEIRNILAGHERRYLETEMFDFGGERYLATGRSCRTAL
jgi:hypothetical protein